ncbi:hypothetical protein AMECASPLE_007806 [Ameca splendens]|uniref:Uncharacterized protein n=1 Tax=Ameca splendens TaxID=208324 RepID=A0ABV0ZVQ7_9TELE
MGSSYKEIQCLTVQHGTVAPAMMSQLVCGRLITQLTSRFSQKGWLYLSESKGLKNVFSFCTDSVDCFEWQCLQLEGRACSSLANCCFLNDYAMTINIQIPKC